MMAIYVACCLKMKTLIIVNRLVLVTQWKELIEQVCPNHQVQFLKTNMTINPEADFYIINAMNICKLQYSTFSDIGTVIADEIHLLCAKSLYKGFHHISPRYFIGLSATPIRPDGLDKLIEYYFGTSVITKSLNKTHHVYPIHTKINYPIKLTYDGKVDWNSILTAQSEHTERNQLIVQLILKEPSRSFLVLCKRVKQGRVLEGLLKEEGESVTTLLGVNKEFDKEARIVIATLQKCGVGFSHECLDALILASDMEEYFIQYLGRVFRRPTTEPIIYDIIDAHSILKKHYQTRLCVYRKSGGIIYPSQTIQQLLN